MHYSYEMPPSLAFNQEISSSPLAKDAACKVISLAPGGKEVVELVGGEQDGGRGPGVSWRHAGQVVCACATQAGRREEVAVGTPVQQRLKTGHMNRSQRGFE